MNVMCQRDVRIHPENTQPHYPLKVLLVEDSPLVQQVNTLCLNSLGCHVVVANNGMEALALFDDSVDLVLMDLSLGEGLDGFAVSRLIRFCYPELTTPIMACTSQDRSVLQDCLAAGMSGVLEKPFLLKQFNHHFALQQAV